MSAYELPAWLDTRFIENALSRTAAPDKAELRDILDKSLALKSLTIQEATRLIRIHDMCKGMDETSFEQMETAARSIKLVATLKSLNARPGGAA